MFVRCHQITLILEKCRSPNPTGGYTEPERMVFWETMIIGSSLSHKRLAESDSKHMIPSKRRRGPRLLAVCCDPAVARFHLPVVAHLIVIPDRQTWLCTGRLSG